MPLALREKISLRHWGLDLNSHKPHEVTPAKLNDQLRLDGALDIDAGNRSHEGWIQSGLLGRPLETTDLPVRILTFF